MNGEKGQALPLAMLALVFGVLVITPFLSHASTSILGSKTYAESIGNQNACDAGIEHAIWSLTNGTLAEQFSDPGDEVTYQLDETINDLTTTVTVTANATGGGVSGAIEDTVIDTLEYNTSEGSEPDIINISGDVFAIAHRGAGGDGFIKTLSVDATGDIGSSVIDTLEFDTSNGMEPDIIHVSGDIYAVACQGSNNDGFVKTVSIDASGNIGNWVISTLEFDTSNCYEPSIIHVSGYIYAVAYRGSGNDGFLKTIYINDSGYIGYWSIDDLEFDTSDGYEPSIIHISGDNYAVAYRGAGDDGFIKTISINSSGDIGNSIIDSLEFDTDYCYDPYIIPIQNNVYAITYCGPGNDGFLKTVSISAGGEIENSVVDTLEFDNQTCYEPVIIHVSGDIYAIVYRGNGNDGFIKTVEISSSSGGSAVYEILTNAGDTSIRAYVNVDDETVAIVSWQIEL